MRHKPKYLDSENGVVRDRWLISYTDVVTILLILFVSIAAESVKARVPLPPKIDPRPTLLEAERKLKRPDLNLHQDARGLVISLPQSILFASGTDEVRSQALPALSQIASVLLESNNRVVLVGHADATPIHTKRFSSNWQLSAARSLSLLALLTNKYGIPETRLSIQGYGSNNPLSSNDTEAGRAANRRVEILILAEN